MYIYKYINVNICKYIYVVYSTNLIIVFVSNDEKVEMRLDFLCKGS